MIDGNYQVQVTRFAADGAVAFQDLELRWRNHLESDTTTVTTSSVCSHPLPLLPNMPLIGGPLEARLR